ncbi:MAG: hypothetical protein M1834_002273 [Cirrosporium novae-zelandiae]|nr:MAG: hypothetical protein M1834_002273 [Cirrosporium novae-zelandiae]
MATQWMKETYHHQYEIWVPWLEDKYLALIGHNKTSYVAKDKLSQTKITGDKNVDAIQDGINEGVSGQFAQGGLAAPVGNLISKEGINRSERGGKDESGSYIPTSLPGLGK